MLATFVKIAYHEGFTLQKVTISQFCLSFVGLFILILLRKERTFSGVDHYNRKSIKIDYFGNIDGINQHFLL